MQNDCDSFVAHWQADFGSVPRRDGPFEGPALPFAEDATLTFSDNT